VCTPSWGSRSFAVAVNIVTLCTGNVARSVMLGYMFTTIAESTGAAWAIRTAGTHVGEGSAMSARTRDALLRIDELGDHRYGAHRSHQLTAADTEWADVILAAEVNNVIFVRANFATNAEKAVQLAQFVRLAPLNDDLGAQLRALSAYEPSPAFNVEDPAGGDQSTYDACARQLWDFARAFATLVGAERAG
jgi:protein-tyrosine-phosphatase